MPIDPIAVITIPAGINKGLTSPSNKTLLQILGMPRDVVTAECRGVTNQPLKSLITLDDVGPFRVTGIKPAVASLKRIFKLVKKDLPEVYAELGTAGMLCVRTIKNSSKLSNHSWGCAIDISIGGVLDGLGSTKLDGKTLAGLAAMAPYFNDEGWYWGVGFSKFEDGMHFEIAEETLRAWHADGTLGKKAGARTTTSTSLSKGDSGERVKEIQRALADKGYDIMTDGEFGPITEGIVIEFQSDNGLEPDGIVGPKTLKALLG
ncbi:MAG: peptidoglycan-binding protein [Rhodobacter sp.]|nr:peptidoglycan-binding protein [Rhodobacter sp.]